MGSNQVQIFLVDDETDSGKIMKKGLEQSGFYVDYQKTASEAISEFRSGIYDIMLLDVNLPDMSGFDLYDKLRIVDVDVKVCFITAFGVEFEEVFKRLYKDLRPECFIPKPIAIDRLARIIRIELGMDEGTTSSSSSSGACSC